MKSTEQEVNSTAVYTKITRKKGRKVQILGLVHANIKEKNLFLKKGRKVKVPNYKRHEAYL